MFAEINFPNGCRGMPDASLIRIRGLDDEPVELVIYDDHIECSRIQNWLFFRRRHSRRSMTYPQITRAVFRTGSWFGTVHLEDNLGTIINVNTIPNGLMQRAERLFRERLSDL
jgi:hypothetical protein